MSYRLEGKDIVIDGFEQGIADTPYKGIADMRNVDIVSFPQEGGVTFENTPVTLPPVYNAVAFTAQASGNTLTVATTAGLYQGCAIVLNTNTAGGISTGTVYYVANITATTFTLHLTPNAQDTAIDITSDGSGTLTTYQYGNQRSVAASSPKSYYVDTVGQFSGINGVYILDGSNYAWVIWPTNVGGMVAYHAYFLGNIGGAGATSTNAGVAVWKDYIFIFGSSVSGIDIADLEDLILSDGPALAWDYAWENYSAPSAQIQLLVSNEDDNLYFTTQEGLGSLIEEPGETFDPTDTTTYALTSEALLIPDIDRSISLAELGANLFVGGINAFIYPWDKVSPGFSTPLVVPETYQAKLVGTDQNLFIFSGNRGRIYISNGASVEVFKKLPDYLSGIFMPFFRWRSAAFSRGELVFSVNAQDNASTTQNTMAGVWAINMSTKALRMLNKLTVSGYGGFVPMVVEMPRTSVTGFATQIPGNGLLVGWTSTTPTYGIDRPISTPYDDGESYIDTDMIPIGSYLSPFTPSQIEWKTSVPIGDNGTSESIAIYYRTNLSDSFALIDSSTSSDGTINGVPAISDLYKANFQKVQWVQFRIVLTSNATTPTYCRLTEIRVRDYPSATNPQAG